MRKRSQLTQGEGQEGFPSDKAAVTVQEPLRREDPGIVPVFFIKVHRVQVGDHHGSFWDCVSVYVRILGSGTENTQGYNVAEA